MVVAWVVSRKTVDFEKKISLFTQEKRYLPRDRFTLTYGNLFFWRNGFLFLHEIWQIHKEHVNEEICVRPKVRIAVQLSY